MYSVYKLNKQGDNTQPWRTPFPIWNQSVFPCPVLTIASWPAQRFLGRQVKWSGIPISLRILHSLLWSTQSKALALVSKAEVDVFLELSCFYDPMEVGSLISGSSAFSKSNSNIWKFLNCWSLTWRILSITLLACAAAAAAKSLQLCPTLCDPTDGSPPGSSIPGILQARTLEWVAISFSNAWKWKVKVKLLSHVRLFATPWTTAYQAPPSMGFSRQEYWSGLPLLSAIVW